MRTCGIIIIRGIVQGVGFRPFVYAKAREFRITGTVKNLGSEVEIHAFGDRFEEFLEAVSRGTPLSHIDSVDVHNLRGNPPDSFTILESGSGSLSGFIPTDVATCDDCIADIFMPGGRYEGYWATSCVNCGPRYSIINAIPYDRERTSMAEFPMCTACGSEYTDPSCRRHHAQTIALVRPCGPRPSPSFRPTGRRSRRRIPSREAATLPGCRFDRRHPGDRGVPISPAQKRRPVS